MRMEPLLKFSAKYNLTSRETDILKIVATHGYTNEQIADSLSIQAKTVNHIMTKLLHKTGCKSSRVLLSKVITDLLGVNNSSAS